MQLAAPSRRTLGLAAVSAIAMSTTLFSLGGVAQAAAVETTSPTFGVTYAYDGSTDTWTVPAGYCSIDWLLEGGAGGKGSGGENGEPGGTLTVTTYVVDPTAPTTFTLAPGQAGQDGTAGTHGEGGMNPLESDANGLGGQVDGAAAGGGGGAATLVVGDDDFQLRAPGGIGGGAGDLGGYPEYTTSYVFAETGALPVDGEGDGGDGSLSATANLCTVAKPSAWAVGGDGALTVYLTPGAGGEIATKSYEYTRDGGTTWTALPTSTEDGDLVGTISGLTNGASYTIQVRAVAENGARSAATDEQTVMAYKPIGAPANVVATKGPSSIVITWDAPTTTGSYPLAGYVVGGYGTSVTGDAAEGIVCETAADVRRCVVLAEPGWTQTFAVTPVDTKGNAGLNSATVTVSGVQLSSTPSATIPTKTGDLVVPAGQSSSVAPGGTIRVTGGGYLAGSTVTLVVYSEPQVLTTTVADASGNIDVTVTVPAGLAAGNHTLVATGVDANGNPHNLTVPITVTGGTTGSGGLATTGGLAYTGASVAVPALGGLAAVALGGGLVLAGRRKRAAE